MKAKRKIPCVEIRAKEQISASALQIKLTLDLSASRNSILDEFATHLRDIGIPYRAVDPRVYEAVELVRTENVSFREASILVFNSPDKCEQIRYWYNKRGACR